MISEKTLRQWRRDALQNTKEFERLVKESKKDPQVMQTGMYVINEHSVRILRLTQDLLDIQLLKK